MSLMLKLDKKPKEDECRYLNMSEEEHLISLIYRSKYRSFFPFSYIDKTDKERFVGYAGAIDCQDTTDDSFDNPFPPNVDIYICPNGMKTPYKRTSDNLINIQNLVIDIDSHNSKLTISELNKHIKGFEKELLKRLIIKPNFINRTGRGIHLWFCIEPCHVALEKICMSVIDMLCEHIEMIIMELDENELLPDRAASLKLNGLFRLPYTYNTKSKQWGEGKWIHDNCPNINQLYEILRENGFKSRYFSKEVKKKTGKKHKYRYIYDIKDNDYTPCLIHRKKFMDYLFRTRDIQVGSRDIMIFGMYSTVVMLMDREDAKTYCRELNDSFDVPLRPFELSAIFKEIDKKQHRFTVNRFFDFVNATEEEKRWFNKLTIKEERKEEKRKAKEERNNRVRELYEQKIPIVTISKELGISRPTIYKILDLPKTRQS